MALGFAASPRGAPDPVGTPPLLGQMRDSLGELERGKSEVLTKDEALALLRR